MADKEIDFEELDRAISALMDDTSPEEDIEALAEDTPVGGLPDDTIAPTDDFEATSLVDVPDKVSSLEIEEITKERESASVPDTGGASVQLQNRVPIGMDSPPEPTTDDVESEIKEDEPNLKTPGETKFFGRVVPEPKKELKPIVQPRALSNPDLPKPKIEKPSAPKDALADSVSVRVKPKMKPTPIKRRGRYMDFIVGPSVPVKPLVTPNAKVNVPPVPAKSTQPVSHGESVDFEFKLATDKDTATTVKGNYKTSNTVAQTDTGDTLTIKRQTMEYVAKPEVDLPKKPEVTQTKEKPKPSKSIAKSETEETRRSPFVSETKIKKRPLGQPAPLMQSPSVTMHVPDRIPTYDTESGTALYRAELREVEPEAKTSKFWVVILFIVLLIVAGLVYYFWADIEALFL